MALKPPNAIYIYWQLIMGYTITGYVVMECVICCNSTGDMRHCPLTRVQKISVRHNGVLKKSGSYISYHPWRTYRCILCWTRFYPDKKIASKFHISDERGWMFCKYGCTYCRFLGRFSYEGWSCWGGWRKKGDFRFWIVSDACRVSLCFRSLYIAAILCNYIQASLS